MIRSLTSSGYLFDQHASIWFRADYSGLNYSDGDEVESRLAALIESATDVSVLSPELRACCTDWPSLYHLSPLRANLLRPFHARLATADVLEIGAGCGAITRFLGECGSNVLALEGSSRRAGIVRSRTRDLLNVKVLAERFDDFQCDYRFDVVTLIGVLEYACVFSSAKNATRAMLDRAREFLKPGGMLLVAIENQLGLKYFAGAAEDHVGISMYGIEGLYSKDQPQTFGRAVLESLLKDAGFAAVEFLVPLPDYKLPVSVITEAGAALHGFNAATLASQSARRDPQLPALTHFSLELAWPQIFENGLGIDIANSFLVAASPDPIAMVDQAALAYHYSVDRQSRFCKEAFFFSDGATGEIVVKRRRLTLIDQERVVGDIVEFDPQEHEVYISGSILSCDFYKIVAVNGWTLRQVVSFFDRFLDILESLVSQRGLGKLQRSLRATLPGDFFDVVPQNLVTDVDGIDWVIDKEWILFEPIELGYLIFRSILMLLNSVARFGCPASGEVYTRREFVNVIMQALGLESQDADYERYVRLEARVQEFVTGVALGGALDWAQNCNLPVRELLSDSAPSRVLELQYLLAQKDTKLEELSKCIVSKEKEAVSVSLELTTLQTSVAAQELLIFQLKDELFSLRQSEQEYATRVRKLGQALSTTEKCLNDKSLTCSKLEASLTEREARIRELDDTVRRRDSFIETLTNSRSWWLTKPLRWSGRIMRGEWSLVTAPYKQAVSSRRKKNVLRSESDGGKSYFVENPILPTCSVAVILPVYRNVEMTKSCILAAMPGVLQLADARLLAINDASPDAGMSEMLADMANRWPGVFEALENPANLGFVGTVNRGLAHFSDHDVVLLNSDVLVPDDWLIRLRSEAYVSATVGTVTPFSNNATICSFPHFLCENKQPFGLDVNAVDTVFRRGRQPCVEAPTGVGFCMYIRRGCLNAVGFLDAERFGRGYGEENDFCQRAMKAGWKNLITPNLYAYHEGGVSFSSDKIALVENAVRVIDELHPNYHSDVQRFIMHDPLRGARVERHVKLLAALRVPKILHVSHGIGGGVGQHIEELADHLGNRAASLMLAPSARDRGFLLTLGVGVNADRLEFLAEEYSSLLNFLRSAAVSAVHVHHTLGFQTQILRLLHDLQVPYLATVHDYYWLGGNPTLTSEDGLFSGDYSDELSNSLYPLPNGETPATWRDSLRPLLECAEVIIFPSIETRRLFGEYYRFKRSVVAAHVEAMRDIFVPVRPFFQREIYTIGVLGALGREKGADYLEEIATRALRLNKSYRFKLLGYAYRSLQNVETTGPYEAKELHSLILNAQCDLVFFPCLCPETYSYTLSYALDAGLPIVAPRVGAFPERLAGHQHCAIYPYHMPVDELLVLFDGFLSGLEKGQSIVVSEEEGGNVSKCFYTNEYIDTIGKPAEVSDATMSLPLDFVRGRITAPILKTFRERLLCTLWKVYLHPSMRWSHVLFTYKVRRAVKRLLSKRPMHEIVRR